MKFVFYVFLKVLYFDSNITQSFCKDQIDNKATLGQVKAWCYTGNKLLPEPMVTQFNDAIWRH